MSTFVYADGDVSALLRVPDAVWTSCYAALILDGEVVTRADDRTDYGEAREISLGMVADECFVVLHTKREGATRLIAAWKGGRDDDDTIKRASLAEIRKMKDSGELHHNPEAPESESLGPDFWASATMESPKRTRSIHLRLNADVFEFFHKQSGGKGHLTKMQQVLRAYVNAHRPS